MKIIRQSLGIDVSMKKVDCCISFQNVNREITIVSEMEFDNNPNGFVELINWIRKNALEGISLSIVMEATGVYYENLAFYLHEHSNYDLSIILPAKVKYYFKSLNYKTKTDKIDALMLAQYGIERNLSLWQPPSYKLKEIKALCREYRDSKKLINQLKNQLHAKNHSYKPMPSSIQRLNRRIELIEFQCLEIESELRKLVFESEFLSTKIEKICTIPGVGFITAISIIAESNGFILIRNAKQLTSYAGLDVQHNNSGTKTGKSRISKKGNAYIRQALYMPALSAARVNKNLADFYARINDKKSCKKIGIIGVSRKLLILIYTLYKNDEYFKLSVN